MPDLKISQLPEITTPIAADVLPIVNAAATKKVQIGNLLAVDHDEHVLVFHSTTQSIPNAVWTALNFDSEEVDVAGFHDNAVNNSRLTVPAGKGGLYLVIMHCNFAANITGVRLITIGKNGSIPGGGTSRAIYQRTNALSSFETMISASGLMRLIAGDFLELQVNQNSGGALLSGSATRDIANQFECVRIGP